MIFILICLKNDDYLNLHSIFLILFEYAVNQKEVNI